MDPHPTQQTLKLINNIELKYQNRKLFISEKLYRYRVCKRVPCLVYLALIFQVITIMSSTSLLVKSVQVEFDADWRTPHRPIPADVIVLENGSTTSVSSLEDYLSKLEQEGKNEQTNKNTSRSSLISDETSKLQNATEVVVTEVVHKAAALFQLEREETTSAQPASRVAIEPIEPQKQANIKHLLDNHHSGHHNEHSITGNTTTGPKPIPQHWQVRSLLNITHDYPLTYSRLIYGYIWPMMAAITLFTNLMIVFVLTQRDMRTPTNVVLTAIAIADIIPIVVPVPWFIYLFALGNEKRVLYPPIACYFYQHQTRSVSEIFYFLSTWLNVLLAVQDYLTACLPHLAKRYCQLKVVVMQIITLTLLAFLLNLPQALKLVFRPVKFYYHGQLTWGCKAAQAKWFKDLIGEYVALYDDVFAAIIVIFVDGGPAAALITLTALLIRQLQKQRIQGHLLMEQARTASKRRRERHRQQEYESSARVMIFVLLASLAVKIPFATTYTMMIIQSRFEIHFVENLVDFQTAITITDLAFVLSYPINFTIFCCCSKKFRHKCVQLLAECNHNTKSTRNRLKASFSMSLNSSTGGSRIYKRPSVGTMASQTVASNVLDGISQPCKEIEAGDYEPWLEPAAQDGKNSIFSSSSLDDRHPLVLERLCDGRHHLQWLHPGDRPPRFRALLSDGTQCYECMARHEDLWASRERRQSADSMGIWPPPPPPPPLQIPHHRLPQIVTTRCESIREQPSSDEANGEETGAADGLRSQQFDSIWPHEDGSSYLASSDEEGSLQQQQQQQQQQLHMQTSDNQISQIKHTAESRQEHIDRHEQQESEDDDDTDEGHLKEPGKKRFGRLQAERANSDQGSTSSFISIKNLKNLMLRRLSGGQEDRGCRRGEYSSASETAKDRDQVKGNQHMDDKHSSLSLSNSKLTTLPNATGQLADILMSTLFMSGSSDTQSRTALSEPPTHASPSAARSRIKVPRRSHG